MNQVFVSTIPQTDLTGQVTAFPLPADYAWLKHLNADGIVAFLKELFDAIRESQQTDDWTGVNKVISAWEETALLMQDQVLIERVRQIRENPEPGVAYEMVREKLGI